jgi:hypothetical protein
MDDLHKNDKKEKLNQSDPYDFDIKYVENAPKSDLNELRNKKVAAALDINHSDGNKVTSIEFDSGYKDGGEK